MEYVRPANRLPDKEAYELMAAATTRRWSTAVLAEAFDVSEVVARSFAQPRRGLYRDIRAVMAEMGEDQFVERYLRGDTVERLNAAAKSRMEQQMERFTLRRRGAAV
jgi:hypothetical protein